MVNSQVMFDFFYIKIASHIYSTSRCVTLFFPKKKKVYNRDISLVSISMQSQGFEITTLLCTNKT